MFLSYELGGWSSDHVSVIASTSVIVFVCGICAAPFVPVGVSMFASVDVVRRSRRGRPCLSCVFSVTGFPLSDVVWVPVWYCGWISLGNVFVVVSILISVVVCGMCVHVGDLCLSVVVSSSRGVLLLDILLCRRCTCGVCLSTPLLWRFVLIRRCVGSPILFSGLINLVGAIFLYTVIVVRAIFVCAFFLKILFALFFRLFVCSCSLLRSLCFPLCV